MKVKTITAPTIHAALIEARRILGDDVVLMESIPADGDDPARITVMADEPGRDAASAAPAKAPRKATAEKALRPALAAAQNGENGRMAREGASNRSAYGYGAGYDAAVMTEDRADVREGLSARRGPSNGSADGAMRGENGPDYSLDVGGRTLKDLVGDGAAGHHEPRVEPSRRGISGPAGRGRLFPNRSELVGGTATQSSVPAVQQGNPLEAIENLFAKQLKLLHDRLDQIERRFDGAIIGAGQAWTVNAVFAALLDQGMRPATVTKIFDTLARKGYEPDTDPETLQWAVAQEIRKSIDCTAPKQHVGAQVFVGPSGAGKTSLLLKLASHPGFFGRRDTAVIVIEPEEDTSSFHQSPLELFRMHGLPVQAVRTVDDMRKAITRVQHFDHILIDTPPMPLQDAPARKVLRHVKSLIDPIVPLRVQFVLNATRSLEDFNGDFVRRLALRPEMVALTHLDETKGWGRIAEWLMAIEMPVQFVSTGPSVPDGVVSFSPTWFVEEMMKL